MQGWISLHRELIDKPIWVKATKEQKVILITLLLMANHEEKEWEWQGEKFKVKAGEFVTSLDSILKSCGKGITIQNIRSSLEKFEKLEFLTNKSTKTGRLISIVNWAKYQDLDFKVTKKLTKNQQRGNKEVTPNNNDNNDNNVIIKEYTDNVKLENVLISFMKFRKKIKKEIFPESLGVFLEKLNKLSNGNDETKIDILNNSLVNGWQGIFEIKEAKATTQLKKTKFNNFDEPEWDFKAIKQAEEDYLEEDIKRINSKGMAN